MGLPPPASCRRGERQSNKNQVEKKKKEKGMRMWDELLTLTMHIVSLVVVNELNTDRNAITIRNPHASCNHSREMTVSALVQ